MWSVVVERSCGSVAHVQRLAIDWIITIKVESATAKLTAFAIAFSHRSAVDPVANLVIVFVSLLESRFDSKTTAAPVKARLLGR